MESRRRERHEENTIWHRQECGEPMLELLNGHRWHWHVSRGPSFVVASVIVGAHHQTVRTCSAALY
eukprot:scaffold934_cov69-Phaeocystis_antarctica.AAC.2